MFPGKERGRGGHGDAWTSPALARACARVVGLRGTASFRRRSGRLRVRPRGPEVAGGGSPGREGHGVAEDTRSASPGGRRPRALLCRGPREDRRAWRASGRRGRVGAGGDSWRIVATSAEAISTEAGVSQGPPRGARARPCAVITQRRPAPCGARGAQRPPPREPDTGSGLLRVAAESRRDLDQRPQLRGAGVPGLGRAAADWAPAGLPTPLSGAPQRLAGRSPRSLGSARLESWAVLTGRKGHPLLWG